MTESTIDTIGCDLGDKTSELYVVHADGKGKRCGSIKTTREGFERAFRTRPRAHVVVEVGTHSRWVSALLKGWGHRVTVANARKLRLIAESNSKDDATDAELLARLGRVDVRLLSPIEHRGEQVQADLAILKARDVLVRCRSKIINQARSLAKSFGYRLPSCDAACFHRKTRSSVPPQLEAALAPMYETLVQLHAQIRHFDGEIEKLAKEKYPDVALVGQPAGVGPLTSLAYVLTVEDQRRFDKSRDAGAFFGLTTKRRKSGDSDPHLRITKAGDPFVRRLLIQCAQYVLGPHGPESDLRTWGLRLCERGGKNAKKRARVAVARKLAVLMHRLWVTGEAYQPVGYGKGATAA